jgi:hypothetical protein
MSFRTQGCQTIGRWGQRPDWVLLPRQESHLPGHRLGQVRVPRHAHVGVRHRTGLPLPTKQPGEVKVTADVDFGALWEAVNLRMSLEESLEQSLRQEGRARRRGKGSDATNKAVIKASKPAHIPSPAPHATASLPHGAVAQSDVLLLPLCPPPRLRRSCRRARAGPSSAPHHPSLPSPLPGHPPSPILHCGSCRCRRLHLCLPPRPPPPP